MLEEGASASYEFASRTAVSMAGEQAVRQETTIEGRLNLRVTGDGARRGFTLQFSPLRIHTNGERQTAIERQLATPFTIDVDAQGLLGESRFPPHLAQLDRAMLDGAVRALQVVLPAEPRERWETTEADRNGQFQAAYHRSGAAHVDKRRLRYITSQRTGPFVARVLLSEMRADVDDEGPWLRNVTGTERLEIIAPGGAPIATAESSCSLQSLRTSPPSDLALWTDVDRSAMVTRDAPSPNAKSGWEAAERERARKRLLEAGATLAGLAERLRSNEPGDGAVRDLASYLRAFPSDAGRAIQILRDADEMVAAGLVLALQLADTPEAQSALAEVMGGAGHSRANRLRAVVAMGAVGHPTDDTLLRLARAAKDIGNADATTSDVASSALLALGAAAPRAAGDAGAEVVRDLKKAVISESDPTRRRIAILALENAGETLQGDVVRGLVQSQSPDVRAVAARMLGKEEGSAATLDLVTVLETDASATVRGATVKALLARPPNPQVNESIVRALSQDREPDAAVRALMVQYLARRSATFPFNSDVLRLQLARETDRGVIVAILNFLSPQGAPSRSGNP
jgi:hypothetical protein